MRAWLIASLVVLTIGCRRHEREHATPMREVARACAHDDLGCARPILYVSDLAKAMAYYRDQLGFRFDFVDGDPPDFGSVSRGATQLFLCQRCQGHAGSWLWVMTPDVDAFYAEVKRRGAIVQATPTDMPWGIREMRIADLDGNVMRVGSPIEHE